MSAEQPTSADILRELRKINKVGQIKAVLIALKTSVRKIETKLYYHLIGLVLLLGIMVWLHTAQNARISRVESRLEIKIDGVEERLNAKIDRIETSFASHRNTACQCEKE